MSKKADNKSKSTSITSIKRGFSHASEKVIVERLKSYGLPLIKSLQEEAGILLINNIFSLSPPSIIECLEFYGKGFIEAISYKRNVKQVLAEKILALPKDYIQKCLELYKGSFIELVEGTQENQCNFVDFLFTPIVEQGEKDVEPGGSNESTDNSEG